MQTNKNLSIFLAVSCLFMVSCSTLKQNKNTAIGTSTGIIIGGAVGGILGKNSNSPAGAILIGAAVGGVTGAAIGKHMDAQKAKIEEELGNSAIVKRVGEGIEITFDSGILFGFDSYNLTTPAKANLNKLISTLKEFKETNILIDGHTDSKGSDDYNMVLSQKRAENVAFYLHTNGIRKERTGSRAFGESSPIATNDNDEGRAQNRRVLISIWANDSMKKNAEDGQIQ